jgi:nucleoside-diphosphate-sugar epimerase
VVTDLVLRGLEAGVVRTRTRGTERRRFLYKDDCAEALQRAFDGSEAEADVAGPEWVRIADLAARIGALLGVPVELGDEAGQEALIDPVRPVPGWSPRTTLDDGLRRILDEARAYRRVAR